MSTTEIKCIYLDEPEEFSDENAIPCHPDSKGLEEYNYSGFALLELELEFEKISHNLPLILDIGQSKNSAISNQKSCPFIKELTFPNYISFVSRNKKFAQHYIKLAELTSDPVHIFCRAESLLHNLVNEESAGKCQGKDLLKSLLFFNQGSSDGAMGHVRSRSAGTRQVESLESKNYPSGLFNTPSQKLMMAVIPPTKKKYEYNFSDEMLLSCSTTNSPCSYWSSSSARCSISTGLLRFVWKSGMPHYVFSVNDDLRELYLASPLKIKPSVDKVMDYMYLFHSKTNSQKDSRKHVNGALNFVGKMKVSSSLVLNSNRSKFIETEFVLFGASEDHSKEMQSSSSSLVKSKGLSKKVAGIFRPSHLSKCTSTQVGEASFRSEDLEEVLIDELINIDESFSLNHLADDFPPNTELATIIVEDYQHDGNKLAAGGGWGLKFLKRVGHADNCPDPSSALENREESLVGTSRKPSRSVSVLVPAGFHGCPISRTGGPSSLTERWRSGGHCDCGGWDIGCPLTILKNKSIYSKALLPEELQEDCKSVALFMEGMQHGEPTLKLVNLNEGLYIIYFQSTLSALQSFSMGVAIIHAEAPDLCPKL